MNERPEETLLRKTIGKAREEVGRDDEFPDALEVVSETYWLMECVPEEDEPFINARYRELFERNEELQYHYFCVEPNREARVVAQLQLIEGLGALVEDMRAGYEAAGIDITMSRAEKERSGAAHG